MLFGHPILQALATLTSLYVLYLGLQRFMVLHFKRKASFNWKLHVRLGTIVLLVWLLGLIGGLLVVRIAWQGNFMTGPHARVGVFMGPFLLIGLISGFYMDRKKKRRQALPLIHGLNNLFLIGLAGHQVWTGWRVVQVFLLGD